LIVDDVDRWQARMNSLLGMLKAWVHDDQPPYLEGLFNADHLNERWLKQFRESRKDYPDLKTLLDAIAFLELSGQAEPNSDSVRWVVENAFALTLINQSQHLSPTERLNLQFKFWQMRKEMPAQLLVTICRFVTNEPAFNCPTKDLFTAVNFYKQSIAKARKRAPLQSTLGLASEVVPADPGRIGLEILTVLDSALQTKPKRRASVFQMLESFLTPEMMFRAFELQQKLAADEKRLLRILRQFQSGSRLEFRSKIKQPEIDDELQTCEVETKPLCAVLAAFKIALNLLNSNELEPKNWLQLLPKIPENIRCQVFTKWHEKSYFTKYKSGDLNYFASQLGKLLAKKDLPESFKAHWQSFANQPHSNDMVIEACQDFEGNRKIHAATIALLARLLELPGQPIASESYSALSSFAASNNDLGYLTTLIVAIGETDQSFYEDEILVATIFSDSVQQNCELLKALNDSDEEWEYIAALKDLKALADYPNLKSAIANLVLTKQLSELRKLQCVLTILNQLDLFESCVEQSSFVETQTDPTQLTKKPNWFDQYPTQFYDALFSLESTFKDAASIADSVLGTDFPNQAKLKAQIGPIEAKIARDDTSPELRERLVVRLQNLRKYLVGREPVSAARLENLQKKLHARVDHEVIQRFISSGSALASKALKRKFGVGKLVDKLLTSPYEMILAEILRLPKHDRTLGLRLLFETQGESTKCFESDPANATFVEKLQSLGINSQPWIESETWEERTADGKPYRLFLTDSVADYLLMGFHFQTCLTPGSCNFFSAISNAVDVNKKVLYGKTADGKVIGRCLFALNNSGNVLTFHRYQHEEKSGFKEAVGRYLENLTIKMNNEVSTEAKVSSLVSRRWYHDAAEEVEASLFDSTGPLFEAFSRAPVERKLTVLLSSAPRSKLIRRFGECLNFVESLDFSVFTKCFIEEFCGDSELSFCDKFRLAVLAFQSAEISATTRKSSVC